MTTYRMTGRPLTPFTVLEGRVMGEEFEADIDDEIEQLLVGSGALQIVTEEKEEADEPAAEEADNPGPEIAAEPEPEPEPKPKPRAKPRTATRPPQRRR
jgi:outer membrane biosynthesis protein TonB